MLKKKLSMKEMSGFSMVNEDVIQDILSRLPALSFASAACVSKTWNKVCSQILFRPKLASALSLNPSLHDAVKEVLDKVFSEPIRPHFAIACIGKQFNLEVTHRLITEKLGPGVPIITNAAGGIIGFDVLTDELREVNWELVDNDDGSSSQGRNRGIVLMVGFVPGLKVDTIPLLHQKKTSQESLVDKFVMDIRNYTVSVSDSTAPAGIILFGDQNIDMNPILAKMDCAMPEETVIVGDASGCFLCRSGDDFQNNHADTYLFDAVALVFARDREKSHGEIQFHVTLSTGIIPFGPQLTAVRVISRSSTSSWLTARLEGENEVLNGEEILDDFDNQIDDDECHLFIGVVQQRARCGTSLAFYQVLGGHHDYFLIKGVGIKPGDSFLFYHSDSDTASSSSGNAYRNLAILKAESKSKNRLCLRDVAGNDHKKEVFGGFIFSCHLRGDSFFEHPNVDSFPFCENFPRVPLAGVLCSEEIGRGCTSSMSQEDDEENSTRCSLHVYSTVYLVLSYVPSPSD